MKKRSYGKKEESTDEYAVEAGMDAVIDGRRKRKQRNRKYETEPEDNEASGFSFSSEEATVYPYSEDDIDEELISTDIGKNEAFTENRKKSFYHTKRAGTEEYQLETEDPNSLVDNHRVLQGRRILQGRSVKTDETDESQLEEIIVDQFCANKNQLHDKEPKQLTDKEADQNQNSNTNLISYNVNQKVLDDSRNLSDRINLGDRTILQDRTIPPDSTISQDRTIPQDRNLILDDISEDQLEDIIVDQFCDSMKNHKTNTGGISDQNVVTAPGDKEAGHPSDSSNEKPENDIDIKQGKRKSFYKSSDLSEETDDSITERYLAGKNTVDYSSRTTSETKVGTSSGNTNKKSFYYSEDQKTAGSSSTASLNPITSDTKKNNKTSKKSFYSKEGNKQKKATKESAEKTASTSDSSGSIAKAIAGKVIGGTKKTYKKTKGIADELTEKDNENITENMVVKAFSMVRQMVAAVTSTAVSVVAAFLAPLAGLVVSVIGSIISVVAVASAVIVGGIVVIGAGVVAAVSLVVVAFAGLFTEEMEQSAAMHQYAYEYACDYTQKVCDAIEAGKTIHYKMGTRFISDAGSIDMDYEMVYLLYIAKNEEAAYEDENLTIDKDDEDKSKLDEILEGNDEYKASFEEIFDEMYSITEDENGEITVEVKYDYDYWLSLDYYEKYQKENYRIFDTATGNADEDIKSNAREKLGMMSEEHIWKLDEPQDLN